MPRTTAKRPAKTETGAGRWLSSEEEAAWRTIVQLMVRLPWAIEGQLQREAKLSFIEYHALARLSEDPTHTLRMSELAMLTNASLSRLSHLVKRLESRGLVRRHADPEDGRYTNATLTAAGYRLLVESAPAHVANVRSLVVDALSAAELRELRGTSERLLARLDSRDT
jgi:DNA-binding MarR family transcriptional regulator